MSRVIRVDLDRLERRVLAAMATHAPQISFGYEEVRCDGPDPDCKKVGDWDGKRWRVKLPHETHLRRVIRAEIRSTPPATEGGRS